MYKKPSRPSYFLRAQATCVNCSSILKIDALFFTSQKSVTHPDELYNYLLIKRASALIICNKNRKLQLQDCLDITYAITQGKQIILMDVPNFAKSVTLFIRELILSKLNKILLIDITLFDIEDCYRYVNNLGEDPINYSLTKHEATLARSFINANLRLLDNS